MKEIIIEVPNEFGKTLKPWKANAEIKGELVRCLDCKFGSPISERGLDFIFCHFRENKHQYATHGGCFEPDWFCADGERKDGEVNERMDSQGYSEQ